MPDFQALRGLPRIFELTRLAWLDLPFDIDEDPDVVQHNLTVLQSLGGQIQTQPGVPSSRLRLIMPAMDAETATRWKLIFDRTLAQGSLVEFVRDTGRYFWLSGDSIRDSCAGQPALSGARYSLVQRAGAQDFPGAISIDPANPGTATRTNLVQNGDGIDVTAGVPTGWVNETPTTLAVFKGGYLTPSGELVECIEFNSLGAGSKVAHIDFQLGGYNATNIPGDVLTLSALFRADRQPNTILGSLIDMDLVVPSSGAVITWDSFTPLEEWFPEIITVSTASIVPTDTTLRLRLTFDDDLKIQPVYLTELQIEPRAFHTAFIPYSTVRTSLTGSRALADVVTYLNGLAYMYQVPSWAAPSRWAFTVAFTFTPGWGSADIPSASVVLYQDGDLADADTVPALKIHLTASTIVATATLSDGSTITATKSGTGFSAGSPVHILATFQDRTGFSSDGSLDLWVDGVLAQHTTHSSYGARQGKFFWIGSRADGALTATGRFSEVALDPVFMDGTIVPITDYRSITDAAVRRDRNSWRCVLDPAQKGRSDRVQDNQVPLDVMLIEHVRTV